MDGEVLTIPRLTNLKDPNINNIEYEQESLKEAIKHAIEVGMPINIWSPVDSMAGFKNERVIGKIKDIRDDSISATIYGVTRHLFDSIQEPVALFNFMADLIKDDNDKPTNKCKINRIVSVSIGHKETILTTDFRKNKGE
jgi:hypothetical protein